MDLKPRLPYYYHFLRDKFQLPVLTIVIYRASEAEIRWLTASSAAALREAI